MEDCLGHTQDAGHLDGAQGRRFVLFQASEAVVHGFAQGFEALRGAQSEAFLQGQQRPLDMAVTGRNIVTRGVRLNDLVGREFLIGNVRCRGVELCDPCLGLGEALQSPTLSPAQAVRLWVQRGGLRADVLADGELAVGDTLTLQQAAPSAA